MARKPRTNDLSFSKGPIRPGDWPADKVERWPVSKLRAYPQNPMMHSDAQVEQIMASMREFGWTIPVLVDEKGEIIAGHGRLMAATKLGLAEVPVMIARGWTEAQRRAYRIADNQLPRLGEFSPEMLKLELSDLKLAEYPLELLGFEDVQLVTFMAGVGTSGDPEATPEPPKVPTTRKGDIWLLGDHRLLCGDCTSADDVALLLDDAKPYLMVTDPPYGVEYDPDWRNRADRANGTPIGARAVGTVSNDDRSDWSDAWKLFPGDVAYCWAPSGAPQFDHFHALLEAGFETRSQIIWAKQQFPIGRGNYHIQHEPCWYAVRKGGTAHWQGDRTQSTLWQIDKPHKSETGHSTQKPIECMKRPIENNSAPGDYVYDPFVGSGTTIIAAEMTARRCLAIEIDPAYVDVCVERYIAFVENGADKVFLSTDDGKKIPYEELRKMRRDEKSRRVLSRQKKRGLLSEVP